MGAASEAEFNAACVDNNATGDLNKCGHASDIIITMFTLILKNSRSV